VATRHGDVVVTELDLRQEIAVCWVRP